MDEPTSWVRRAKYSHTVCHRLDSSRLASFPLSVQSTGKLSGFKSRPESKSIITNPPLQQRSLSPLPKTRNPSVKLQRSLSPLPKTAISDVFKEARSSSKRFSTPDSRRSKKCSDKVLKGKTKSMQLSSSTSPLRHLASITDKSKNKKDSAWTKYFDHGGGKVNAVEASEEHTVDMSKLFLGQRFAHGAHSRIHHGIYKDEAVAVKIVRIPDDDENGNLASKLEKQFNREVTLLSRLHHPNVIKFVAGCKNSPVYCVITEYLSEGSLRAYLHKLEQKSLPLPKLIGIALDITRGMEYIHSQGVIHRDLKPENILIDKDFHMKIADFDIACEEVYCDMFHDPGTYRWMAPEMIKHKSYGKKVDVYSFGLILWEMVAGKIPYDDMNPVQAAFAVVNKNLRPVIPVGCPPCMKALIEQCWSLQPDKRPEFWQVMKVLEQFESSLARDGTLNLVQNSICLDHKKGLLHWIQKLAAPTHPTNGTTPVPKPKFT
ncbi:hypothetical protein ACFE04_020182 [Oxalis oulophora]